MTRRSIGTGGLTVCLPCFHRCDRRVEGEVDARSCNYRGIYPLLNLRTVPRGQMEFQIQGAPVQSTCYRISSANRRIQVVAEAYPLRSHQAKGQPRVNMELSWKRLPNPPKELERRPTIDLSNSSQRHEAWRQDTAHVGGRGRLVFRPSGRRVSIVERVHAVTSCFSRVDNKVSTWA